MPESSAVKDDRVEVAAAVTAVESTDRSVVAKSYGRRDFWLRRLLAAADVLGVLIALLLAGVAEGRSGLGDYFLWGALSVPAWLVLFKAYGLYDRDAKRVSHSTIDDLPWLFHALLLGALLLWAYYRWGPVRQLSLLEVSTFGAAAMTSILVLRSAVRRLSGKFVGPERVLIVGRLQTLNLISKMRAHPEYGLNPVGVVPPRGVPDEIPGLPVVGYIDSLDLKQLAADHQVDRLMLSHTELKEGELVELLRESKELGLKVSVLPQLFDVMGPSVEVDDVEGVTVLGLNPPVLPRSSRSLKRALDVIISASLLVILAPLFGLVAVAIKLDSRGPILFRQRRVGKGGERFQLLKFRTMVRDADRQRVELEAVSADPNWLKLDDDPRVTRVGRFLRLASLDELPQLWNVLKGEMSLVGPRPLIEEEDRQLGGWARHRLDLTPGITGPWQVLGRTDIPFAEMLKLDYLYVTNWSLWTDIKLMIRTFPAVVSRRGAN